MANPEPGEQVQVPWGLDVLRGTVLRVYDAGRGLRVVVTVEVPGLDAESVEDVSVTLPAEAVEPWPTRSPAPEEPGHWAQAHLYERSLQIEIERELYHLSPNAHVGITEQTMGGGADFSVAFHAPGREVFFLGVVKHTGSKRQLAIRPVSYVLEMARSSIIPIVLFSNVGLSASANKLIEGEAPNNFYWVRWRGAVDNVPLASTLSAVLDSSSS